MTTRSFGLAVLLCAFGLAGAVHAQDLRDVPAKQIPVPTDVSPELARIIGEPLRAQWDLLPKTGAEWKPLADAGAEAAALLLPGMEGRLGVSVERTTIDGVRVYVVTPKEIAPRNQNRVLIHIHGGCYVLNPREAALSEAIIMAGIGRFKVLSVDYRMPPEATYPGAHDDVMTVYKSVLKTTAPKNIGIFGTSAGGALTLSAVLRAKAEGLPLPGAIAPGTPMSDTTKVGDTFMTNAMVDNVLVSPDGFCDAGAKVYANGFDLKDPMMSPVYGDMAGFPPTILTSGTRDLLLSNTVRVHRKLRRAGVEAALQVYEGQSHAQYMRSDEIPETREAFGEIAAFLDTHLGE